MQGPPKPGALPLPPVLLPPLLATPALLGASAFAGLSAIGVPLAAASAAGFVLAFGVRAGAILFGWRMPGFPGRTPPDP